MVQFPLVGSRWRIGAQTSMLLRNETGDQFGIHPVGFGAVAHGLGIVPGIHWVKQEYGIALPVRQISQQFVISARGLQADAAACRQGFQPSQQSFMLIGDAVNSKTLHGTSLNNCVFGNIHPNVQKGLHDGSLQK